MSKNDGMSHTQVLPSRPADPTRSPEENAARRGAAAISQRNQKKKRKKNIGCCLGQLLLFLIALVFTLYSVVAFYVISRFDKKEMQQRNASSSAVYRNENLQNILLICTNGRTDSKRAANAIFLLTLSSENKTFTITEISGKSNVSIPTSSTDKLSKAYTLGGAELLMDAVQDNYLIAVQDYICVSLQALAKSIDALGGVEMTLAEWEVQAVNEILSRELNAVMGDISDADLLTGSGTFRLKGKQALAFSQIAEMQNPFCQPTPQPSLESKMLEKVKHLSPLEIHRILNEAAPLVSTSLSTAQLYFTTLKLPYLLLKYQKQELSFPAQSTYSQHTSQSGETVYAVDFDANLKLFEDAVTKAE